MRANPSSFQGPRVSAVVTNRDAGSGNENGSISSPEPAFLLASTNQQRHELWPDLLPEDRDLRTSSRFAQTRSILIGRESRKRAMRMFKRHLPRTINAAGSENSAPNSFTARHLKSPAMFFPTFRSTKVSLLLNSSSSKMFSFLNL